MSGIDALQAGIGDKYLVERELGRGGMATVYLARDQKLDRSVAIKVLLPDLAAAVGADRFRREIEIVTKLSHPHILPLYDWGEADGLLYYVMPFVQGESLRGRMEREHQLPIDEAVRVACEVGMALEYAHGQGILHRDIKPENILLAQGQAIIADFGIARVLDEASSGPALTQTGVSIGTPTYMSPEQALGEKKIDGRADQYSLACVLYEMLAGHPPFSGGSMQALIMRHTVEQVPPLRVVRGTVSPELEDVIMRALSKSPADRWPNSAQFVEALLSPAGFTSSYRVSLTHGLKSVPAIKRRRRLMAAGGAATVVLAVGLVAWRALRPAGADVRQMGAAALGLEPRRVAVQYFRDVSATQKLGDLSSGLTEGLIDQLSQVQDLDIVSKSGVSVFANKAVPRDSVVRALKAAWLVEGSVDEDGPDVRVTVKLIDGASGADVETAAFKQPAGKAVALRETLVRQVSDLLRQRIGGDIRLSTQRREARNDDAWLLVQRADKLRRAGDAAASEEQLPQAAAAYASADSLLAQAELLDAEWPEPTIQRSYVALRHGRGSAVPKEKIRYFHESMAHADRAIATDPRSPQMSAAYEYRGSARFLEFYQHLIPDQREADAAYLQATNDLEQATKLAPRNASAWTMLSNVYAQKPDFAMSKLAAANAYTADPFMLRAADILDRLYRTSYITETFNDADKFCTDGHARFPADARFLECWLWLYTVPEVRPNPPLDTVWMLADSVQKLAAPARKEYVRREAHIVAGIVLGRLGKPDSAKRVLDRVKDTPRAADPFDDLLGYNAYAHLTLGDKKGAIELIKTYLARNPEHREGWGKDSAWWWRELKKDPDFQRLIARGS